MGMLSFREKALGCGAWSSGGDVVLAVECDQRLTLAAPVVMAVPALVAALERRRCACESECEGGWEDAGVVMVDGRARGGSAAVGRMSQAKALG
jgi:hypothetical protein